MNDNIFKNLEEEHKKSRITTIKRGIFYFILLVIFGFIAFLLIQSSMTKDDVQKSLKIISYRAKWIDKKITPFEVSIVPAIWIKLENMGKKDIQYLQLNGRFEFKENQKLHSSGDAVVFQEPFKPGEISEEILIKANYGYTASSREAFIQNKEGWKEMQVKIFARTQGSSFAQLGELFEIQQVISGINGESDIKDQKSLLERDKKTQEIVKAIEILSMDSIWISKVETSDRSVIVPQITFKVKNKSDKIYNTLIFKGLFLFKDEDKVLGEGFNTMINREFNPAEISDNLQIKSDLGYSASSKKEFFLNSFDWKYIKVRLYVKSIDTDFALLGNFPIKKKIQGVKIVTKSKE